MDPLTNEVPPFNSLAVALFCLSGVPIFAGSEPPALMLRVRDESPRSAANDCTSSGRFAIALYWFAPVAPPDRTRTSLASGASVSDWSFIVCAAVLGQTGKLVSSNLVQARERDLLLKPIEAQEFLFASSLLINNNKVLSECHPLPLPLRSRPAGPVPVKSAIVRRSAYDVLERCNALSPRTSILQCVSSKD